MMMKRAQQVQLQLLTLLRGMLQQQLLRSVISS
jgi:hypothetical protein